MDTSESDRRQRLADAAIEVIGTHGLRALTHRATEQEAALPAGTCSYHFPTRQALLAAVHQRIADLESADIAKFVGELSSDIDPAVLIEGATATLAAWLGPARVRSRASLLLRLDPPSRQMAAPVMESVSAAFQALAASVTDDARRAVLVMALIDGIIVDELTRGTAPVDLDRLRASVTAVTWLALRRDAPGSLVDP